MSNSSAAHFLADLLYDINHDYIYIMKLLIKIDSKKLKKNIYI
jgi:hypothetical protein